MLTADVAPLQIKISLAARRLFQTGWLLFRCRNSSGCGIVWLVQSPQLASAEFGDSTRDSKFGREGLVGVGVEIDGFLGTSMVEVERRVGVVVLEAVQEIG